MNRRLSDGRPFPARALLALALLAFALLAGPGCTGQRVLPVAEEPDLRVKSLLIAPESAIVVAGDTRQYRINAIDFDGNAHTPTAPVVYECSSGRITAEGVFYAPELPGVTMIKAKYAGIAVATDVVVVPNTELYTLTINPETVEVQVGSSLALNLVAKNAQGIPFNLRADWTCDRGRLEVLNPTLAPARITYKETEDIRPAQLTTPQRVIYTAPQTPGHETIRATIPETGQVAVAQATIIPGPVFKVRITPRFATVAAGATQLFAALPEDRYGNLIQGPILWMTTNGAISQDGVYQAPAAGGAAIVMARHMGIEGAASVNSASIGDIYRIAITPSGGTLRIGESTQFRAVGYDQNSNEVALANPTWETDNGQIDGFGFYYSVNAALGTCHIRCRQAGVVQEVTIQLITWQ